MPVLKNEAGIDCGNCGHCVVVKTRIDTEELAMDFCWVDGYPLCPQCHTPTTFHDYIDE